MDALPLDRLVAALGDSKLVQFYKFVMEQFESLHLKELDVTAVGPHREMRIAGHDLVNFGFDSFLGLDQDDRVIAALARGAQQWGTQFGASRAFASCHAEVELEQKIANWMQAEAAMIFPSVTLANVGALPGLVEEGDLLVVDEYAHNSILEGTKIARANGVRVVTFAHNDPAALEAVLMTSRPYRMAVIAIDGVYSMSGVLAALPELNAVAKRHDAVLYVDDAHATGVLGQQGRGTVLEALGSYDNVIVVGCLSKACSVFGAFVCCPKPLQRLLKMRSTTYIFGGPVPPPYLEAVNTVVEILASADYQFLRARLDRNIRRFVAGLHAQDFIVLGGESPIVSVLVGGEEETFRAGKLLFDAGYYVQSVTFPAVAYHAGVLRVQINANHKVSAIDGLIAAFEQTARVVEFPRSSRQRMPAVA